MTPYCDRVCKELNATPNVARSISPSGYKTWHAQLLSKADGSKIAEGFHASSKAGSLIQACENAMRGRPLPPALLSERAYGDMAWDRVVDRSIDSMVENLRRRLPVTPKGTATT